MSLDMTLVPGDVKKPAVIFIHGLGMDKRIWVSPDDARIFAGRLPVSVLVHQGTGSEDLPDMPEKYLHITKTLALRTSQRKLTTVFHDIRQANFTVIAWSQQRPSAEIAVAVSELRQVITEHREYCRSGIILIGHSRGGLIARTYLASGDGRVLSLITLATPHQGSRMAVWATYLGPLMSILRPFLSKADARPSSSAIRKITEFLSSRAVKELLPNSPFFASLDDSQRNGVYYLTLGGREPTLFSLYKTVVEKKPCSGQEMSVTASQRIFSVPEVFERLIPKKMLPDEMKKGRGDGLVSVDSSRLPWSHEHHVFDLNHAGLLFDPGARAAVMNFLNRQR